MFHQLIVFETVAFSLKLLLVDGKKQYSTHVKGPFKDQFIVKVQSEDDPNLPSVSFVIKEEKNYGEPNEYGVLGVFQNNGDTTGEGSTLQEKYILSSNDFFHTIKDKLPIQDKTPQVLKEKAGEFHKKAVEAMEQTNFEKSIGLLQKALFTLKVNDDPYNFFSNEIFFISCYYKVCYLFLVALKFRDNGSFQQMAWILGKMCDIPIQQPHRLIIAKAAIRTNFLIGNFGTTSTLIKVFMSEQQKLEKMFEKCKEEGFEDKYSLPLMPMCYQTGRIINYPKLFLCHTCKTTFHPSLSKKNCGFCLAPCVEFNQNSES